MIVDMNTQAFHLRSAKEKRDEERETFYPDYDCKSPPDAIVYDRTTNNFLKLMESCSREIDRADKYEKDIVCWVNPNVGKVNKMYPFPIILYEETSHAGMMKVFFKMGKAFQLFDLDKNEQSCKLLPNWDHRQIDLGVGALTARNICCIKLNLVKKLIEIRSAPFVLPLLESLNRITCVHDYLHEMRFHCQDAIYRNHYGSFLQPFQYETGL